MSHTDKALADNMEQIKELSLTCQQYIFEGQIDLGNHELVVHALLDRIQDACNDWIQSSAID